MLNRRDPVLPTHSNRTLAMCYVKIVVQSESVEQATRIRNRSVGRFGLLSTFAIRPRGSRTETHGGNRSG
jgi:hypothetical protein